MYRPMYVYSVVCLVFDIKKNHVLWQICKFTQQTDEQPVILPGEPEPPHKYHPWNLKLAPGCSRFVLWFIWERIKDPHCTLWTWSYFTSYMQRRPLRAPPLLGFISMQRSTLIQDRRGRQLGGRCRFAHMKITVFLPMPQTAWTFNRYFMMWLFLLLFFQLI